MKGMRLCLLACLALFTLRIDADPPSHGARKISVPAPLFPYYLKDLEKLGYCVIPQIFSAEEAEVLYQRVWHEYIERAWPACQMNDRANWKETFPIHNKYGIFVGPAGQIQVMWDLRQDPRIVEIFARIWNTQELIVSMDGLSIMCPPEIRDGYFNPWPHVDQTLKLPSDFVSESILKTHPFTIQGQFLFEESVEGDGGFYCIPKSHLKYDEFSLQLEAIESMKTSSEVKSKAKQDYLKKLFEQGVDESGRPYVMKHITATRGSLILWDSRTVHWNQYPSNDRPSRDIPKVRMIGYLCYVPKTRLTEEAKKLRQEAFETGITTNHDPANPKLRRTKGKKYLEDASYSPTTVYLTPLGESLLN